MQNIIEDQFLVFLFVFISILFKNVYLSHLRSDFSRKLDEELVTSSSSSSFVCCNASIFFSHLRKTRLEEKKGENVYFCSYWNFFSISSSKEQQIRYVRKKFPTKWQNAGKNCEQKNIKQLKCIDVIIINQDEALSLNAFKFFNRFV